LKDDRRVLFCRGEGDDRPRGRQRGQLGDGSWVDWGVGVFEAVRWARERFVWRGIVRGVSTEDDCRGVYDLDGGITWPDARGYGGLGGRVGGDGGRGAIVDDSRSPHCGYGVCRGGRCLVVAGRVFGISAV
jgi:hypothetical protein